MKPTSEGFGGNVVGAAMMSEEQPRLDASGGQSSIQDRSRWEEGIKVKEIVEIYVHWIYKIICEIFHRKS